MLECADTLWKAADKLRGHLDAAAYKHVVLALLFLRFVASGKSSLVRPPEARWERVRSGRGVDDALRAVEQANPALSDALPRDLERIARLDELLELVEEIPFTNARDTLGRAYEYFLARFARAEGRRGGQFYTPRCVVDLLGAMLGPFAGRTVYDPCCGSGGMFVQGGVRDAFGQESNPATWRLARMNLALHGVTADLGPRAADSFTDDLHGDRAADVVLANPPFNQSDWGAERLPDDPRWRFGRPPPGNANFAWLSHIVAHLAPGGTAGVVLANGSLSATKAGEGAIRRRLVESGHVDAMVALPPQLFFSTTIPACVWILSDARPDETLLIDARPLGTLVERARRELTHDEIARLADCYRAYRDVEGLAVVASRAALAARGHVLAPGHYVPPTAPDGDAAPARLQRLHAEWADLAAESERLARELREQRFDDV